MGSPYFPIAAVNSVDKQQDSETASTGVMQAIKTAAVRTGVDFSYLVKKATAESGLDSTAKSSASSATGLFQFTSQTWLSMVKNHGAQYGLGNYAAQITQDSSGHLSVSDPAARHAILALRNDPQTSAEMAGELDKQNAAVLKQNVGGTIGGTELYLAHFLGASGASDFLSTMHSDPNIAAADVVPGAAASNQSVFFDKNGDPRSLKEIYQHFAAKFGSGSNVQVASATPAASTVGAQGSNLGNSAATSNATMASLIMPTGNAATATSSAATGMQVASANLPLSGSSTLFAAMVLGQMNQDKQGAEAALSGIQPANDSSAYSADKKKNDYASLAAVA